MIQINEKIVARFIILWIFLISILLGYIISVNPGNNIFQFGPNTQLFILGICIDTPFKYIIVVSFCFINSGIRTMNHNILQSWITNMIQDNKTLVQVNTFTAYEISNI